MDKQFYEIPLNIYYQGKYKKYYNFIFIHKLQIKTTKYKSRKKMYSKNTKIIIF